MLRIIQNRIKMIIHNAVPRFEKGPRSQLQGGILGYLYHHRDGPVYQRDLEKEFRISRATATNTLQVMERDGLIVRRAQDRDGRLKRIQMTPEAYQNHEKIERHMDWIGNRVLEGMSDQEVAELYRLLGILMKNLEGMTAEPEEVPGGAGEAAFPPAQESRGSPEAPAEEARPEGAPAETAERENGNMS